jgi:ArsR family transcriptional regulator
MNEQERQRLERRALLLKSLAHPSRLLIIELLEKGPRCGADLTEAVGADKTTVSKHLAVLKKAGLVRDKKRGTWSDYELVCDCVSHFIDCIEDGKRKENS